MFRGLLQRCVWGLITSDYCEYGLLHLQQNPYSQKQKLDILTKNSKEIPQYSLYVVFILYFLKLLTVLSGNICNQFKSL